MSRRMRFVTWAKKDPEDTTMIKYTFHMKKSDGTEEIKHFTSDDMVNFSTMKRIQQSWIKSIERKQNGTEEYWDAVLYED